MTNTAGSLRRRYYKFNVATRAALLGLAVIGYVIASGFLAGAPGALAAGGGLAAAKPGAVPNDGAASQVTLVMVEETGCPYCARWHRDIGSVYDKTPEGRFAPLKTVFIHEDQAKLFKRVIYTPTFIVVKKGKEVGRILGYSGQNFFWPMLEELLIKAGYHPEEANTAASQG